MLEIVYLPGNGLADALSREEWFREKEKTAFEDEHQSGGGGGECGGTASTRKDKVDEDSSGTENIGTKEHTGNNRNNRVGQRSFNVLLFVYCPAGMQ